MARGRRPNVGELIRRRENRLSFGTEKSKGKVSGPTQTITTQNLNHTKTSCCSYEEGNSKSEGSCKVVITF